MGSPTNPVNDKFGRPHVPVNYDPAGPDSDVTFSLRNLPPPSPYYVRPDESLLVQLVNSVVGINVRITARLMLPDGTVQIIQQDMAPTSNRATSNFLIGLSEGYLLNFDIGTSGASAKRGQCFAQVSIQRGSITTGFTVACLAQDYVASFLNIAWPAGRIISSLEGPGVLKTVTISSPAAGVDWATAVPATVRWRLQGVLATLTTSAAVANRVPRLQITDASANTTFNGSPNQSVPASQAVRVSAADTVVAASANVPDVMQALPAPATLMTGWVISSQTTNIQVADQWSAIVLAVEEWIEV